MNRYEQIKQMSKEEMAMFLTRFSLSLTKVMIDKLEPSNSIVDDFVEFLNEDVQND
jgi:hypothetical protein